MATCNRSRENKWTPEEDEILTEAVTSCGSKICWGKVASKLEGRTNKSCRKRWIHSLDPTLRKGRWSPAEDALLLTSIRTHGRHWYRVADLLPGRTDDQCAKRWREKLDPSIRRDPWTEAEDQQLLDSLAKLGKRWNLISGYLKGRPSVHCRNRWLSLVRAGKATDIDAHLPLGTLTPASSDRMDGASDREATPHSHSTSTTSSPLLDYSPCLSTSSPLSTLEPFLPSGFEHPIDLGFVFNPAPLPISDQDGQISALNLFQSNLDTTKQSRYPAFNQTPSKSHNLDLNSIQNVPFTWDTNLQPRTCDFSITSPSSMETSTVINTFTTDPAQPSQDFSHPRATPLVSPSSCSGEESSFRMTCPLPYCQFQSGTLIHIWRHITWEHVGNRTTGTTAMEELVEKVVMGGGTGN